MEGLPLLPGFSFDNHSRTKFTIPRCFVWEDGRPTIKKKDVGIANEPLAIHSILYSKSYDPMRYDPSLTYGRTKQYVLPMFKPNFVLYDKKCLGFKAYFQQDLPDSPNEPFRIRRVNIVYFLEDDTMTIMEPPVINAGYPQGKLVVRNKVMNEEDQRPWHWTDLNVGAKIKVNGNIFHLCSCDTFTREYLMSQGVEVGPDISLPEDPIFQKKNKPTKPASRPQENKQKKWFDNDGKVLRFSALWDTRDKEFGDLAEYGISYYLVDDTIEISNIKELNSGKDPTGLLLKRMRIPKDWRKVYGKFPSCYLEITEEEVDEYYEPKDFIIGSTIFLLGRRFLIRDCDEFTRKYYAHHFNIEQGPAIVTEKPKKEIPHRPLPPYMGFGTVEDSIQSWYHFDPSPPRTDVVRYLHNMGKRLRYTAMMECVHPEDKDRQFVIEYRLSDGTVIISELRIRNSGFKGGTFLKPTLLPKPGTNPDNPEYYTPVDFDIGSVIQVFSHKFKITGVDLAVYRYMEANREKFPVKQLMSIRKHLVREGHLTEDVKDVADFRQRDNIAEPLLPPEPNPA